MVRFATIDNFSIVLSTKRHKSSDLLLDKHQEVSSIMGISVWADDSIASSSYPRLPHCHCGAKKVCRTLCPGNLCSHLASDITSYPWLSCGTPSSACPVPCLKQGLLEQVAQDCVHSGFEYHQGQRLRQRNNF